MQIIFRAVDEITYTTLTFNSAERFIVGMLVMHGHADAVFLSQKEKIRFFDIGQRQAFVFAIT